MNLRLHIFCGQLLWLAAYLNGKALEGVPGSGRRLVIKSLPPVEDYQSNVYEVFMEPYFYELGRPPVSLAAAGARTQKQIDLAQVSMTLQQNLSETETTPPGLQAVAFLRPDGGSGVSGELLLSQLAPGAPVTLRGNISGLPPGLHGLHVHQGGAVKDGCADIGPHFVAFYGRHGGPRDPIRHVGDLGNIKVEEGVVEVKVVDHLISLSGPRSVLGRALAVTKAEDDYGRAGTEDSALTGSSGPPVACGVIGYL